MRVRVELSERHPRGNGLRDERAFGTALEDGDQVTTVMMVRYEPGGCGD